MDKLHQAIDICAAIDTAMDDFDLEMIDQLDQQRQHCIKHYFEQEQNPNASMISQLKQKNDELLNRLMELQQQIRRQQIELGSANKAAQAYLQNQR